MPIYSQKYLLSLRDNQFILFLESLPELFYPFLVENITCIEIVYHGGPKFLYMWQELEKKLRRPSAMRNVSIPPSVRTHPVFFAGLRVSVHFKSPNTSLVTVYQGLSCPRASPLLPGSSWPKTQHWEGEWPHALEHSTWHAAGMSTDPASGHSHRVAVTPRRPAPQASTWACTESPPSLFICPVTKYNLINLSWEKEGGRGKREGGTQRTERSKDS